MGSTKKGRGTERKWGTSGKDERYRGRGGGKENYESVNRKVLRTE